ncbi:MAG: TatD family hydrolase [Spirochaetales bacterium]|nr:TatD family hydrolase [Spirochaetales bacterium]
MNYIDSHFHTQFTLEKGVNVFSFLDESPENGFVGGIDIGCVHDDLPGRRSLLQKYPHILLSAGMGPWEAGASETRGTDPDFEYSSAKTTEQILRELDILRHNIETHKPSFIGEIGLDYYWEYGNHDKQKLIFETQMRWADEMGLCVLIHDRDADEDVIDVIRRLGPSKGGVIHCFDGDRGLMETALEHGYYISFAGNLTFKKNTQLRELIREVPADRLLLETDSPYLTPVPLRGRTNSPEYIVNTYNCAAELLGMDVDALSETITDNFRALCAR